VPITEQIVARFAEVIGAAVCEPSLIRIPPHLVGIEFSPGRRLEQSWVHGSRAQKPVVETNALAHRNMDDNAVRQATFFALYDWLWGGDDQWLRKPRAESMYFSHDHGWYLPPTGPTWDAASLSAEVGTPHSLGANPTGIDDGELRRLADRLDNVTPQDLEAAIAGLPGEWPVSDVELEGVVAFAYGRAGDVAVRMRAMIP
jgi:hypothetical protein